MKLFVVLLGLSMAVMGVMIFQAVRQEFNLRNMKTRTAENTAEVSRKEEAIVELKNKIKDLKAGMASVNTKMDELRKKKADTEKSTKDFDMSLQTCNTEKGDFEKKKVDMAAAIIKFKADHEDLKKKAEEDIKNLKQQILDRDKAICAYADTTKAEARKLCGMPDAPQWSQLRNTDCELKNEACRASKDTFCNITDVITALLHSFQDVKTMLI